MIHEVPFGFPRVSGFGDGRHSRGRYPIEYYYSQGMQKSLFGISTGYQIQAAVTSDSLSGLLNIKWFADASGTVFGVASDGKVYYEANPGIADWTLGRNPGAGYGGQGLIGDQKGRLLYFGATKLGKCEGTPSSSGSYTDSWKTGLTDYEHPADTYEDMVIFGNKSAVGLLDNADNLNLSALNLPSAMTVDCLQSGPTGILIGANLGYRGALILWNTQTDRSLNQWIWTNGKVQSITRTDSGWIVVTQKEILLTNGYTTRALFPILDDPLGFTNYAVAPQGTLVNNNKLFILNQYSQLNSFARAKAGLYIFDLGTTLFEFIPMSTMNVRSVFPLAIYAPKSGNQEVFVGYQDAFLSKYYIGKVMVSGGSAATFVTQILAPSPTDKAAEAVVLNVGVNTVLSAPQPLTFNIAVKIYTFKRQLWGTNLTNQTSAAFDQIHVDGSSPSFVRPRVGDEITILEGVNAGFTAHVTQLLNAGTNTEVWNLDTVFPAGTETGVAMNVQPWQKADEKTITAASEIPQLYFNIKNKYRGKKFLAKVVIENANVQIELHDGLFVYDDLALTS